METTLLGNSGMKVSRLGFGGCPLGGHGWGSDCQEIEGVAAVRRAFECGVNFFDTADVYGLGKSEELLAEALGSHRHDVVIASKGGVRWDQAGRTWRDLSPSYLCQALENSLRRLRLDCLPLYYIHWPNGDASIGDAIDTLEQCRRKGKIRAIGVSNFSIEQLRQACEIADISAIQVQYSMVDREAAERLLPAARTHNIPLVTWGSLAQGLLTGKFSRASTFAADDRRSRYENFLGEKFQTNLQTAKALGEAAARLGRTPAQIAIRWLLDTPGVGTVLFGAKRPQQVIENVGAIDCETAPEFDDRVQARELQTTCNHTSHRELPINA